MAEEEIQEIQLNVINDPERWHLSHGTRRYRGVVTEGSATCWDLCQTRKGEMEIFLTLVVSVIRLCPRGNTGLNSQGFFLKCNQRKPSVLWLEHSLVNYYNLKLMSQQITTRPKHN